MHQTIKKVFRLSLAICIFVITAALVITCVVKAEDILKGTEAYQSRKVIQFDTDANHQYILMSNNQRPDQAALIVLKDQGYMAKLSCEHYLATVCTDQYNLFSTRYLHKATIQSIGNYFYFQNLQWIDIQNNQSTSLTWSQQDIQQFYQNDINNLKYILGALILFSFSGLYVCYRILRNFKTFIH
ncbi:hypothetical protein IAE19_11460 [Acinetobacter sp. S40]|uniref:hypothetical protein n=1 Tax=unclassified Acinetobacter TaxID=196816 RepID=UPI001909312D|nr:MULTISPECIES: hypothetical protein [unclassified Acinetobacter]MBJ9986051.1 hypothetical protein [Acinetobacter sp. S40]MBK0064024.1 hypothetical protein [Acinetobacter sp. S55]MBK0067309.1 hypothetical protein [Acinetobacter sp. S54]